MTVIPKREETKWAYCLGRASRLKLRKRNTGSPDIPSDLRRWCRVWRDQDSSIFQEIVTERTKLFREKLWRSTKSPFRAGYNCCEEIIQGWGKNDFDIVVCLLCLRSLKQLQWSKREKWKAANYRKDFDFWSKWDRIHGKILSTGMA
jgi:hypothetical protein